MTEMLQPDIGGQVRCLRTDEGGRNTPIYSGYRPQFYYLDQNWACSVFFKAERLELGDTAECLIVIGGGHDRLVPTLKIGAHFEFREGARIVAEGVITKIF